MPKIPWWITYLCWDKPDTLVAHKTGGTTHANPSGLTVIPRMSSRGYGRGLYIGNVANWTADVAVGDAGRCAADPDPGRRWVWFPDDTQGGYGGRWVGEARPLVSFHIGADRLYDTGTPIARACTYWNGGAYERYNSGIFTVRIYGRICDTGESNCTDLRPGGTGNFDCGQANRQGYSTTFAPGPNCGPRKWPSSELREAAARGRLSGDATLGYAEWCDFTVDGARRQ